MPSSPQPDRFWLLDRVTEPEGRESLQVDCPEAPNAYVVFTTEAKALAYREASLGPEWEAAYMKSADLAELLAEFYDAIGYVVFDPGADSPGRVLPIFQAIVELS